MLLRGWSVIGQSLGQPWQSYGSDIIVVLCDVLIRNQQLLLLILLLYLRVAFVCVRAGTWHHFRTEKSAVTLFRVKTKTTLV